MSKISAVLLCAVLALSLTACHFTSPAVALTINGMDVPAGVYLMYQFVAMDAAAGKAADSAKPLEDEIDGMPAADWVHAETVKSAQRYVYLNQEFDAQGLADSMTEEELANLYSSIDSTYETSSAILSKNGIGAESFRLYYMAEIKYNKLVTKYAEENTIPDAEVKTYFDDTYANADLLYFPTASTDENKTKMSELAAELNTKLSGGASLEELAGDTLKEAFALADMEYTDESLASYYSSSYLRADSTSYPTDMIVPIMAAKVGQSGVYDYYGMQLIWQRVSNYADETEFEIYKSSVVSEMHVQNYDELIAAAAAELAVSENASAVRTYSAKKVVLS